MTEPIQIRLFNAQQANADMNAAYRSIKPHLLAGHRFELSIRPTKRSDDANARLHAMLTDISKQVQWAGSLRDVLTWKRLMTGAWLRALGEQVEILPAVDGHGVDVIYEPTSRMSGAQVSSLMQYIEAWGADHGVKFKAPEYAEA